MKKTCYLVLATLILTSCKNTLSTGDSTADVSIIPRPMEVQRTAGEFQLNSNTVFVSPSKELDKIAVFFHAKIQAATGFNLIITSEQIKENIIKFELDENLALNAEGYFLEVTEAGVTIRAKRPQGIFYGMQSVMQLLPPEIESTTPVNTVAWKIPVLTIKDQPVFGWRGLNLDVSRHFIPVDAIKKQLDVLALFKINKFHWHLTDDQGWRIEVKKYPKLTEIGAKRKNDDGSIYEGYYTQEEIKEIVGYAKERYIDVIPEIDVPGHVVSVLAAYPELSCTQEHIATRTLWGIDSSIFCAGRELTFRFLEDVFEEITPLFPFEYVHIGGDEVPKDKWESCAHCQKRMTDEGLRDEAHLQTYFMTRIEQILATHQKKIFGWDEILEGGISASAGITSWTGEEGGITAANAGHSVVMNPAEYTYLNFYQGDHKVEPMAFGGFILLEDIYNYNPVPSAIAEDKRKHILGAQASVWTEYAPDIAVIEYQLYPRILAMAELTWTAVERKDYKNFEERLLAQYVRLDKHNINYHLPLPEGPSSDQIAFVDQVSLKFETTRPATLVYTVDGSNPTKTSRNYSDSLTFDSNTTLKIASVLPHGKMSGIRTIQIQKQELVAAAQPEKVMPGLAVKTVKGHFKNLNEVDFSVKAVGSTIDSLEQANVTYDWGRFVNEDNFRALSIEGYIDIEEDGVYFFSTTQDQVWIGDQLLIDYKEDIKRHPKDASIALAKGKHKLKIIYLNNVTKGWASDWNTVALQYRKASEIDFETVGHELLSH
ncbi:family 20 glycosylhydrolase [Spongiimicrobium salis]|uniref:family 20 glycosylhydrolase n=1 Tax=Spongiimicrobium salis TaxID=1667022 RepID=UPI00374D51AF